MFGNKKNNNQGGSQNPNDPNFNSGRGGNNPSNTSGGGLVTTPPDVKQNLDDAESSYKSSGYNEARYSLQQAMLGVELEIGNQILKSLPETVTGLKKDTEADQVASMGWGWSGLMIQRDYTDGKDKMFGITIANNAVWLSAVNMYLSGGYGQTTGGDQNWKQIKVKGYRAIIEYDDSSGYKVSVPIGQSSLIVYEGVNFASEQEMMTASNVIDIDSIKTKLGEQ
ncbi:MAG: hypothetical protein HC811_07285 [Flammeovirgaceae bacterium]|nr:hypothetical protein [Flammeovirgaceae bacterium]